MKSKSCFYFLKRKQRIDLPSKRFSVDGDIEISRHSFIPDSSDKFFTINENYCPTVQNYPLNYDDIIRQTLWYYVENVSQD